MPNDEFNYIDETAIKQQSKKPLIIIIIIVSVIIIALVVGLIIFNSTKETEEKEKDDIVEVEGTNKLYDRVSGLMIPKSYTEKPYDRNGVSLAVTNITANKTGYIIELAYNNYNAHNVILDCTKVLIDNFATSVKFKLVTNNGIEQKTTINIPKTELDLLEITDFKTITLLTTVTSELNNESNKRKIEINSFSLDDVDNKKNRIVYDEIDDLSLSVYKTSTDSDNTYIYFDIENKSQEQSYDVYINKLLINGEIYNYKDFYQKAHYLSETIFYLAIPKKEFPAVERIELSFFFIYNQNLPDQIIKNSNLKEVFVDKI